MTRTKPCLPSGSLAAGNSGACQTPSASGPAPPDRFDRCPVGLRSRPIAISGDSEAIDSRHLPAPSPRPAWGSPQARPRPDSSSAASTSQALPAGSVRDTGVPGEAPESSTPVTVAAASASVGFTSRRTLTWLVLLAGLKVASPSAPSAPLGAVASIAVTKPSVVRTYPSASTSSASLWN